MCLFSKDKRRSIFSEETPKQQEVSEELRLLGYRVLHFLTPLWSGEVCPLRLFHLRCRNKAHVKREMWGREGFLSSTRVEMACSFTISLTTALAFSCLLMDRVHTVWMEDTPTLFPLLLPRLCPCGESSFGEVSFPRLFSVTADAKEHPRFRERAPSSRFLNPH